MVTREHGRSLSRWKDNELPAAEADRIEAHLAECVECRKAADVIDAVRRHIAGWTAPDAPADMPERVLSRVHAQAAKILSMKMHLRLTAAAAAVLLVASLAFYPFVAGAPDPAIERPDSIADGALDEMMHELARDYLPGSPRKEEDR